MKVITCCLLLVALSDAYVSLSPPRLSTTRLYASSNSNELDRRKEEIQQKIDLLKKAGKIKEQVDDVQEVSLEGLTGTDLLRAQREKLRKTKSVSDQYSSQLSDRLGKKARYLGIDEKKKKKLRTGQLGSATQPSGSSSTTDYSIGDPDLLDDDDDFSDYEEDDDLDEEALVDLVAAKLAKKRALARELAEEATKTKILELKLERLKREAEANSTSNGAPATTGIGGAYAKNETALQETRKPSRGSWGYFERPKDISKAYGGGRRVGQGYQTQTDKDASYEQSRQRMKEYRVKMGIDVKSETDHAQEIDEAVNIAKLAMQRGVYGTAVSALEKVTQWCSSNSKVGSNVFLELAMAYEAVGRSDEATQVYTKLSKCTVPEIKNNAKRLLYGLESYEFMKKDAQLASFNRKKIRSTFIETTGMDNFASNFDDAYNTAYIDTSSREYQKLTENVVRSVREARQILLKATDSDIVPRTKIVQALRSISRRFDEALRSERTAAEKAKQPVAMIDGKPIVASTKDSELGSVDFNLASPEQTIENLNGEWRLQLVADRTGGGVQYFNKTLCWQQVDTDSMQFTSEGKSGFMTVAEKGSLKFEDEARTLSRKVTSGGGMLTGLLGPKGGAASNNVPQQIMTVDSILLVTRNTDLPRWQDINKEYFAVWRKVEPGTFSKA